MKKVLVIATHPDDEILGCGATVALHVNNGDEVLPLILCEGESMRKQDTGEKVIASYNAAKILGTNKPIMVGLPDQHLDALPIVDIVTPIEEVVNKYKPNIIYCQYGEDLNKDHQIVFNAALVAIRPKNTFIEEIYCYYTVGSTEWNFPSSFIPNTWVTFDKQIMEKKVLSFNCYESEACLYPNPRSSDALINMAKFFGNQVCSEYAEGMMLIRKVKR